MSSGRGKEKPDRFKGGATSRGETAEEDIFISLLRKIHDGLLDLPNQTIVAPIAHASLQAVDSFVEKLLSYFPIELILGSFGIISGLLPYRGLAKSLT